MKYFKIYNSIHFIFCYILEHKFIYIGKIPDIEKNQQGDWDAKKTKYKCQICNKEMIK